MRIASQSACSRMVQLNTSGAAAAMASAARAMCVGVQMFGGASTMYLRGAAKGVVSRVWGFCRCWAVPPPCTQ